MILLAFAIEARVLPSRLPPLPPPESASRWNVIGRWQLHHPRGAQMMNKVTGVALVALTMILLAVGEFTALTVVAEASWRSADATNIYAALGFGLGILVALPVRDSVRATFSGDAADDDA